MKEKVLVTGASGFIGSHLVKELRSQGYEVYPVSHSTLRDAYLRNKYISYVSPDYIFHLSAYGNNYQQQDKEETLQANVVDLVALLGSLDVIPYKIFVNMSSSSVLLPYTTMYAGTKLAGEAILKAYIDQEHKPICVVRPFSVYGPGEGDHRFIPTVFRSCLTGEAMTLAQGNHDWVYIQDVVDNLIELIHTNEVGLQHVGTGKSTTNEQVVHMIEDITGKKANITERKQLRSFDTNLWVSPVETAPTDLFSGLRPTYEYYAKRYKG